MISFDIIKQPIITEKSTQQAALGKYFFRVSPKATKGQIKEVVEKAFNVKVTSVHTLNMGGKLKRVRFQPGYTDDWKKAIVTLAQGQKIEFTA